MFHLFTTVLLSFLCGRVGINLPERTMGNWARSAEKAQRTPLFSNNDDCEGATGGHTAENISAGPPERHTETQGSDEHISGKATRGLPWNASQWLLGWQSGRRQKEAITWRRMWESMNKSEWKQRSAFFSPAYMWPKKGSRGRPLPNIYF